MSDMNELCRKFQENYAKKPGNSGVAGEGENH